MNSIDIKDIKPIFKKVIDKYKNDIENIETLEDADFRCSKKNCQEYFKGQRRSNGRPFSTCVKCRIKERIGILNRSLSYITEELNNINTISQ